MTDIYLLLGSNIPPTFDHLKAAAIAIEKRVGKIVTSSGIYKTEAWGFEDQDPFLNQVLQIHSSLQADELLAELLLIEKEIGRIRYKKWHPRTIDIDILLYGREIIQTKSLSIPHPQIQHRNFTLIPLNEIAMLNLRMWNA